MTDEQIREITNRTMDKVLEFWSDCPADVREDHIMRRVHLLNAAIPILDAAGFAIVPKEPTEAMILAAHKEIDWCRGAQNTHTPRDPSQKPGTYCADDIVDAYRAMLRASRKDNT